MLTQGGDKQLIAVTKFDARDTYYYILKRD